MKTALLIQKKEYIKTEYDVEVHVLGGKVLMTWKNSY